LSFHRSPTQRAPILSRQTQAKAGTPERPTSNFHPTPGPCEIRITFEGKGPEIVLKRRLTLRRAVLPPEAYESVRGFFDKIRAAEQAPVVLAKD